MVDAYIILLTLVYLVRRVDKTRLHEIVTYGLMVSFIALFVDVIGCEYVLWGYPTDLLPFIPPLFVTDFCLLPITYMFLYQYFRGWKPFLAAALIVSAFLAFIAEEIAIFLGLYEMNNWRHLYSFPMYFVLALSMKWVLGKIVVKQAKN